MSPQAKRRSSSASILQAKRCTTSWEYMFPRELSNSDNKARPKARSVCKSDSTIADGAVALVLTAFADPRLNPF